jgi:hypothetical protein
MRIYEIKKALNILREAIKTAEAAQWFSRAKKLYKERRQLLLELEELLEERKAA